MLQVSCSCRSLALSVEKVLSVFEQPLFLHRSWRWRPRPDRRRLLMLLGVSAGGGGDTYTSRPGTLGALLRDWRSAEEAGSRETSGLDSLDLRPLGLGGEDLRIEILRFFFLFTSFLSSE